MLLPAGIPAGSFPLDFRHDPVDRPSSSVRLQ
jgi:hypothetical protein